MKTKKILLNTIGCVLGLALSVGIFMGTVLLLHAARKPELTHEQWAMKQLVQVHPGDFIFEDDLAKKPHLVTALVFTNGTIKYLVDPREPEVSESITNVAKRLSATKLKNEGYEYDRISSRFISQLWKTNAPATVSK